MKLFKQLALSFTLLVASFSNTTAASDQELYDPAPPADAAFVRVISAIGTAAENKATIGAVSYTLSAGTAISAYQVVLAGSHPFKAGELSQNVTVEAGKYYTLALYNKDSKATLVTFEDMLMEKPAKAYLYFYNLSDVAKAALHSPKHKVDIVSDVASGGSNARDVKALTLGLSVKSGETVYKELKNVELTRRTGISVVLSGSADKHKVTKTINEVKR